MDSHVLRVRTRAQGGAPARSRLRPLAVYKPSFSLNNNNQCYHQGDDETQALLGAPRASPTRCLQQRAQPPPPVPARCRRDVAPSVDWDDKLDGQHRPLRDSPPWDGDSAESNCCCGAVALPWARAPPAPAAPPAPPPPVARAMNTHGIFSHGPEPAVAAGEPPRTLPPPPLHPRLQPPRTPSRGPAAAGPVGQGSQGSGREDAAVHRGAPLDPPWTGSGREMVSTASAAVDGGGVVVERSVPDDNEDGVVRRMLLEASAAPPRLRKELLPPLPPLASAPLRRRILVRTKPDIPSRLCSADAPLPAGHMDRFNKFRFGGRVGDKQEGAQGQGAPGGAARGNGRTRTSDKTERLRELTERLKGGSGGSEQRAAAPPSPSPSPSPSPTPGAASAPQTLAAAAAPDSPEDADLFDLRLARPESRAIVGSYIQRTIPFRSASFSQVDFSDGKYFRHSPRATWLKPLSAAATLPRKRTDELSSHPSPTPTAHLIVVEPNESHGSTPSVDSAVESAVDSAVGSDEGCCFDSPVVTAKVPGSTRSMTHPLASRQARIETRPHDGGAFLSVDGLRHLVQEGDDVLSHTLAVDTNRLTNSTSSLSDVEAPATSPSVASEDRGDQTEGNLSPSPTPTPTPLLPPPTEQGDIKPLDNPVSYEVFVRQFPNYKEYEKWMNESVLLQNGEDVGDHHEWREQIDAECGEHPHIPEKQSKQVTADSGEPQLQHDDTKEKTEQHLADQANQTVGAVLEHDDRCINNFDPSTCPKCLEQMETGPSILQKLKASFHMEDLELEPHEKELFSRHSDLLLRKWAPPTAPPNKTKHSFERSKSEPKETLKEDAKPAASAPLVLDPSVVPFHRTKSTDEPERGSGGAVSTVEPPRISLPDDMKDATSRAPPSHQDMDELRRRRPKDEPRRWLERPKLICQSSDERDDESSAGSATPSRPRFPMIGRSDSLSEGESDQGDRRPSTPSRASPSLYSHLDLSDSEGRGGSAAPTQPGGSGSRSPHTPRRYSKRPLRGPYGQMLEAEMKKPDANRKLSQYTEDLKFLEAFPTKQGSSQSLVVSSSSPPTASGSAELTRSVSSGEQRQAAAPRSRHQGAGGHSMDDSQLRATALPSPLAAAPGGAPKRKVSAVDLPFASLHPGVGGGCGAGPGSGGLPVCHQRTTSSPSQLEGIALRADMEAFRRSGVHTSPPHSLKEAAAKEDAAKRNWKDTRTHVVVELYETERSYVESLEFLVKEYMQPLKKPENAGMVDSELVEQIFYQVPAILALHQEFLDDLQKRLENWDFQQKVGDVLLNAFTKRSVIETYTAFINNWKTAKEAIKSTCQAKPAFARYLEAMAREHKGKLDIDSLLIKLVQRIPGYELLIQQLLKHTDQSHADHALLLDAQREIHELAVKINCTKMESLEAEQQQQVLRDLEQLVEGCDLVAQGRAFLRHDMVTLATGQGARKDRVIFLFSDLVVIARTKRNLRKPSTAGSSTSVASGLEGNRYRCSIKAALDDLEIVKAKDESLRRVMREMEQLSEDVAALTQITELVSGLHLPHAQQPGQQLQLQLEELARDLLTSSCRQLAERQNSDSQLSCLDLTVNTSNGVENITVIFPKPDKRSSWEEEFNEAKTRLALSADRRPSPKFKTSVPIRKTRAGLQFTCAAPTLPGPAMPQGGQPPRDVWVCNSDGYVGQVCVLSLLPEPNVTSCNGVCNARILCVAAIPAGITGSSSTSHNSNQGPLTNSKAVVSISVEDADKASRNLHLDSSSSSSDEDEDNDSGSTEERQRRRSNTVDSQPGAPPPSVCSNGNTDNTTSGPAAGPGVSSGVVPPPGVEVAAPAGTVPSSTGPGTLGTGDDGSLAQPTMWLGTEDGCIHVYSCNDNIRIKRNKVKIQHGAAVQCIMYFDNRVFVSLANGDITVYNRDQVGGWNTTEPYTVTVGSAACPVTRMVPISGRLWCSCQHTIKILNTYSLQVEQTVVAADSNRAVTYFVVSGLAVWLSVQNSAVLKLYHASTFEHLGDVNVAPAVTKMLASCDDIIRQHKAACLRVTSLLACKDLLWIGTSAGVILTMPLPHIAPATTRLTSTPNVLGVPHGHTGHVRFLTVVEAFPDGANDVSTTTVQLHQNRHSWKNKSDQTSTGNSKLLVISGGDGYEDFRTSSVSEVAGKEDSTNHLLMWQV